MLGSRELWLAGLAIVLVTALYGAVSALSGVPAASGFLGHSLGIVGFTLMLSTETLYSLRKRAIRRPWGRMSDWLKFHIFTGIVGPYLVLLHSAWEFNGLAGVVMLMTVIVVLSGFVGRYIYTAVPRTADGVVMEVEVLRDQIRRLDSELISVGDTDAASAASGPAPMLEGGAGVGAVLTRGPFEMLDRWQTWRRGRGLEAGARERLVRRRAAIRRRRQLERQIATLSTARRMLSLWHGVHIPLGMALFVAASVHAAGALYYATLLR